jgi:hypothetical protein
MDRTPCFNTLAADRHMAQIERNDARIEAIEEELSRDMTRALSGLQAHVPGVQYSTGRTREVLSAAADEVVGALDYMETAQALMLVLKDSACPLVAALREQIVSRYAHDMAESLAEVRG